jgi:F-type H+-transporting ATPase subunit delta
VSTQVISQRYARALMNLVTRGKDPDQNVEAVGQALAEIVAAAAGEELAPFLASQRVTPPVKDGVLKTVLTRMKAPEPLPSFVRLLNEKRRIALLPEIAQFYQRLADRRLGRAQAEVTVAEPLAAALQERLRKQLERATGMTITLNLKVDPAILGGAVTRVGSTVWDGSVRHHLAQVRERLLRG